jgi:NAD(P)H-hydrate repair Nnr-like enzyme with NAD(P)H-hydrate dehydratase domain
MPTVLTPHPLEAARLLGCSTADIQAQRLQSAEALAAKWGCTVVLKGSGTVIACPGQLSRINPTGNGRLATAGTGDVLAGGIGAKMAQGPGTPEAAFEAASATVYQHGQAADNWPAHLTLTASGLAQQLK